MKKPFQQPAKAVQDAPPFFKPLKNGEKQKSHFLLFELKKSMDGLFQQPVRGSAAISPFSLCEDRAGSKGFTSEAKTCGLF
ncbi:MAG: hypothetical protein HYY48_07825 [Gammaproteobacteria bacterium]|nr:hypothetical protein [Gammaproteobacteria bacterium]